MEEKLWQTQKCILLAQSCLTLCDPMDHSPPGPSVHGILQARILKWVAISFSGDLPKPRQHTKSGDIILPTKVHLVKAIVFPVVMYGCDRKESWAVKNWCFWIMVWEKTLESPLDCKEMKPVNSKGNQAWKFIERTDAEAEAPILWPLFRRTDSLEKTLTMGKDWSQEEKGMTEDEMVGWHHQLNWHEFKQALRVGHGQGSLGCYSPWGCKESDMTEWLNWTELNWGFPILFFFFPLFLCIVCFRRLSYLSLLFLETWHSVGYMFLFLLCILLLFVRYL